jgi:hypothetical protein
MKVKIILVIAILATVAGPVLADDIQPPSWRGKLSTTSQMWEFSTLQPNPILPDGPAPGGQPPLPSTKLSVTTGPTPWDHWMSVYQNRQGVWPLSGKIDVTVDDHNPPNEVKYVWVQITWISQDVGEHPILENLNPAPVGPPTLVATVPLADGWFESTYSWEIRPNPPDESFTITGTINVDELVIDTWCIPEPATVALLATGGVLMLLRRTRR